MSDRIYRPTLNPGPRLLHSESLGAYPTRYQVDISVNPANTTKAPQKQSNRGIWAAILLNFGIAGLLLTVVFVPVKLTDVGPPSTKAKALYVTGITILATIFASFTGTQIRSLWLRKVDNRMQQGMNIILIDPLWRTIIGVSSVKEAVKHWMTTATILVAGLTTTAVVAGLTSSTAGYWVPFSYYLADAAGYHCLQINFQSSPHWKLVNGSDLSVPILLDFCPTAEVITLVGTLNVIDPQNYGYADEGVAVRRAALGAPASIYSLATKGSAVSLSLNTTLTRYGTNLLSTSQCVPVMTANPIKCVKGDNVTFSNGYLTVTSLDGCSAGKYIGSNINPSSGVSVGTICPFADVGMATIVIGGIEADALYLAESMRDPQWIDDNWSHNYGVTKGIQLYGVTCSVDTTAAIRNRNVTLTLLDTTGNTGSFARSLDADGSQFCDPISLFAKAGIADPVNDKLRAIAALGAWQPLSVGLLTNFRQVLLSEVDQYPIRNGTLAFSNSRTPLEDVLGLMSALAMAHVPMTGFSGEAEFSGIAKISNTRVGSGQRWALVYTIPPLLSGIILLSLLLLTSRNVPYTSSKLSSLASHVTKSNVIDARYQNHDGPR